MKLVTLLRFAELDSTGPNAVWNTRYCIGNGFQKMVRSNGVGLVAIMTEYDIESVCAEYDGLVITGSATNIAPEYYGDEPWETPELSRNTDNHTEDNFLKNFIECCKKK